MVGTVNIGSVRSGDVSDYWPIEKGKSEITGDISNGQILVGYVTIPIIGSNEWTLVLNNAGKLELEKD